LFGPGHISDELSGVAALSLVTRVPFSFMNVTCQMRMTPVPQLSPPPELRLPVGMFDELGAVRPAPLTETAFPTSADEKDVGDPPDTLKVVLPEVVVPVTFSFASPLAPNVVTSIHGVGPLMFCPVV